MRAIRLPLWLFTTESVAVLTGEVVVIIAANDYFLYLRNLVLAILVILLHSCRKSTNFAA